jgi:hypothetical protein
MKNFYFSPLLIAACVVTQATGLAGTIEWNSPPAAMNLDSNSAPMSTGFVYELGVFSSGFQPTPSNVADWAANWHVADRAGRSGTVNAFGSSFRVPNNKAPFTVGAEGWIMGKKDSPTGTELILFRNNHWTWPAATSATAVPTFAQEWHVDGKSTMDEVILGSVNPQGSPFLMQSAVVRSYEQWAELHLGDEPSADPEDDAGGDGVPNLVKFAFGMDPRENGVPPHTPVGKMEIGGAEFLKISIPRNSMNLTEMEVEVSSDLQNWHRGPAFLEVVHDNPHEWVVRDKTPFSETGGKRYMRVKVGLPK